MTQTGTYDGKTASEYLEMADRSERRADESFERSDTDGFLSQWASQSVAREYRLMARLAEENGRWTFPALFDLDGNLVAAKLVETRYGLAWALLDSDDPYSRFVGWFNPSEAKDEATRRRNNEKKGYLVGTVRAPGEVRAYGNGVTVTYYVARADYGFSRDVEIVDTEGF